MEDAMKTFLTMQANIEDYDLIQQFREIETKQEAMLKGPFYNREIGKSREYQSRNRYSDILPYDHNRLTFPDGDDPPYTNASVITYPKANLSFICTQGPLAATVDDFWAIVAKKQAGLVVMLTSLKEGGKEKCAKYWLDEEEPLDLEHHKRMACTVSAENRQSFIHRRMLLHQRGVQDGGRRINHLQFTAWPDHGVPRDDEELLGFIDEICELHSQDRDKPIVIHCSAGVGRTGTVIAILIIRQLIEEGRLHKSDLDIERLVMWLRSQRVFMVQTADQYLLLHRAVVSLCKKHLVSRGAAGRGVVDINTQS